MSEACSQVKLGDVCEFVRGPFGGSLKKESFVEKGFAVYEQQHAIYDQFEDIRYFIDGLKFNDMSRFVLSPGDLIMSCSGTMGKVAIVPEGIKDGVINQALLKMTPSSSVDIKYLKYWVESDSFQNILSANTHGAAIKNVASVKVLKDLKIPLPPLKQQKRIAAILDKSVKLRRKRQQAIQLADEFLRAVFLDMFGDPVSNPKGWEVWPIKVGIESIKSGWSAKGESYPCDSDGIGVLKISAVTSGVFSPYENKSIDRSTIPSGKKLLFPRKGDLIFSRANTRELVAATCIVQESRGDVFLPDKLWLIKTNLERFLPEFLNYMIWQPRFKDALTSQATGTSGSMLNISKAKFENTAAIFPLLDMQKKFKEIYWRVQATIAKANSSGDCLSNSFNSISKKAFSGQL